MWNPLSWVMEAAAIMAIALANGGVTTLNSMHAFDHMKENKQKGGEKERKKPPEI